MKLLSERVARFSLAPNSEKSTIKLVDENANTKEVPGQMDEEIRLELRTRLPPVVEAANKIQLLWTLYIWK
jgi:hypothetical protein